MGCQNGVVIHHQKMCKIGKLLEGQLTGGGESAAETKIFAGREDFAREGGVLGGFHRGRVGAVITNYDGDGANGLVMKRLKKTGKKFGAEARGHKSDDFGLGGHTPRMAGLR